MAQCRASVFRLPCGSVLLVMNHLTVVMAISALQFEEWTCAGCGELRVTICHTLIWDAKCSKYVVNSQLGPLDPACACSMMGQFEYLAMTTR